MLWRRAGLAVLLTLAIAMSRSVAPHAGAADLHVPILVFHNVAPHVAGRSAAARAYEVPPAVFEEEMAYLRDRAFTVVPLSALVGALTGGPPVPARAVVITFDDGWVTQYLNAVPVLRRFGYTATFFVFTNPIGRDTRFMTWDQLRELQREGMTIGSHSWTHPRMTGLSPRAIHDQVAGSRATLEKRLGTRIDFFAHPFGEHPPEIEAAVREAGYVAARGFPGGAWNSPDRRWALHSVVATENVARFRQDVEPPR